MGVDTECKFAVLFLFLNHTLVLGVCRFGDSHAIAVFKAESELTEVHSAVLESLSSPPLREPVNEPAFINVRVS